MTDVSSFTPNDASSAAAAAAAWYSSKRHTAAGMTYGAFAIARNSSGGIAESERIASRAVFRLSSCISFQSGGHTSASGEDDDAPMTATRRPT